MFGPVFVFSFFSCRALAVVSMPARGDGVGGVVATAGVRSRAVCGPKMRARPGGSVSRARRAARPRKPRRGGRRSAGYGLARWFCTNCTFAPTALKIFSFGVSQKKKPSAVRQPELLQERVPRDI